MMSDYTDSVINKWLNVSLAHVSRVKRRLSNKTGTKYFQLCLFGVKITIIILVIVMCFQENSSRRCTFNYGLRILKGQNMMEGGNCTLIQPGATYVEPAFVKCQFVINCPLVFFHKLKIFFISHCLYYSCSDLNAMSSFVQCACSDLGVIWHHTIMAAVSVLASEESEPSLLQKKENMPNYNIFCQTRKKTFKQ